MISKVEGVSLDLRATGVLVLTIDRAPERYNSLDEKLHRYLGAVWREIHEASDVRVAVITGKGNGFCSGGDIEMEQRTVGNYAALMDAYRAARELVENMIACEKPIISAINGPAAGAGLAVALMADISFIAEDVEFTDGHVNMGVAAGDHAALLWPLLCGMAKAKYYLLTGDRISGAEAERIGLVSRAVPRAELLDQALGVADRLASGSQAALHATKRALNGWLRMGQPVFEASLALEMFNFFGPDAQEGIAAFAEKRAPDFERSGQNLR